MPGGRGEVILYQVKDYLRQHFSEFQIKQKGGSILIVQ